MDVAGFNCPTLLAITLAAPTYSPNGWFNNPEHPSAGSAGAAVVRYGPTPKVVDYQLPDILNITKELYYLPKQNSPPSSTSSAFFVFFAQFFFMDIVDISEPSCPRDFIKLSSEGSSTIGVAKSEPGTYLKRSQKAVTLSEECVADWSWRRTEAQRAKNWATGYLDGSAIYGSSIQEMQMLRAFHDGKVGRCSKDGTNCVIDLNQIAHNYQHGIDSQDFPQLPHSPYVDAIRLMWLHWHNHVAEAIANEAKLNMSKLTEEKLFLEARRWTIASFQSVVDNELGLMLSVYYDRKKTGYIQPLTTYDTFAAAAASYILFQVPQAVLSMNSNGKCNGSVKADKTQRVCHSFSTEETSTDVLLDLIASPAKQMDFTAVDDLRQLSSVLHQNKTFDLLAVSIGRGRDLSLPTYAEMLRFLNISNANTEITWEYFRKECKSSDACLSYVDRLEDVYADPSHVELLPGGILNPVALFGKIMEAQFDSLRQGDPYWYAWSKQFNSDQVSCIKKLTMSQIISVVTNSSQLQSNPFRTSGNMCWIRARNSYKDVLERAVSKECPKPTQPEPKVLLPVVLTLLGLVIFTGSVVVCLYAHRIGAKLGCGKKPIHDVSVNPVNGKYIVREFVKPKKGVNRRMWRDVYVEMKPNEKTIRVLDLGDGKTVLRKIVFVAPNRQSANVSAQAASLLDASRSFMRLSAKRATTTNSHASYNVQEAARILSVRIPNDAHLVLKFSGMNAYNLFIADLTKFFKEGLNANITRSQVSKQELFRNCVTKAQHKKKIEKMLRAAFIEATKKSVDRTELAQVATCEITLSELASLLRTDSSDKFTISLFNLIDKDGVGVITYRVLVDFMALMTQGDDRERLKKIFSLYDKNGRECLDFEEFADMLTSLAAMGNQRIPADDVRGLFDAIIEKSERRAGGGEPKILFDDFWEMFSELYREGSVLALGGIIPEDSGNMEGTVIRRPLQQLPSSVNQPVQQSSSLTFTRRAASFLNSYWLELFWGTLYVLICIGLFCLRFLQSYTGNKAVIAIVGFGAPVARASALVVNFTFATLVLLMARNVFTALRESFLRNYFPFDSLVEAHKFLAVINLIATALHTFAHVWNFYRLSQLPLTDLWCLMPELKGVHPPFGVNTFVWLGFTTLTGVTGFLLIAVYVPIFAFAFGRSFAFRQFWWTHQLWYLAAFFLTIHGLGCLLQTPLFYAFFIGPAIILAINFVMSASRSHEDLRVVVAAILPSNVVRLEFEKPQNIEYVAGQYVRIRVPECGHEYHPFTLTSAPHEKTMSLNILKVGPWTTKLNEVVSNRRPDGSNPLSFVQIEGPYGEGHQDWHRADVAVLIGAGIGVTPFASILKHISHMLKSSYMPYSCQKVYFLWTTRNQKQFEWLTDIIRDVEENDKNDFTSTQIYITQFQSKFDFRTIMLYVCERNFQGMRGRSIFTGLRAITHFGRPDFKATLRTIKAIHPRARSIGVFTCGPNAIIPNIEQAVRANNEEGGAIISHYYEVF